MTGVLSRRTLFKGAAAAVVGWSAAGSTWVTAAEAAESWRGTTPVPRLDGTLETAPAATGPFARDFGGIVTGAAPYAVLRTGSVGDVATMIDFARANGLTVAMSGQSGTGADLESHSNYGQAQTPGGVAIDAKGFAEIEPIGRDTAVVGAGVSWAQLSDATLRHGLIPAALTDYLHLSVGGTISVGGIGGTAAHNGLQCDIVQEIEIVTGEGEVVTASRERRRDLFEAALAGGGQVGIIVRATVRLAPAPDRALVTNLFYDDLATFTADHERILADGRFSFQEGEIARRPDDSGWRYKIEAVAYYGAGQPPDQQRLLAGLSDVRADIVIGDVSYREWIFRFDEYEAFLKDGGYWEQAKPWLSLVLPASRTEEFLTSVVAELVPADLGAGFAGIFPFSRSRLTCPLFATPAEPTLYLFDLLRFPEPGDPGIERMLEQNRRLYDRAVALGGKRYLVGAIPGMDSAQWEQHFGPEWDRLRTARRRYDPQSVLTPGQGFFR